VKCDQRAVRFTCTGSSVVGIIDLPERPLPRGVLIAAGHPYSRLGARRQFAMLARALARRGIAVMRFDRRGVGDSDGCDYNDSDVRAALQEFCDQVPLLQEVVLLSPGGSAAIATARACAAADPRVCGLLLLAPWGRSRRTQAPQLAAVNDHQLTEIMPPRAQVPALTLVSAHDAAAVYWRRAPAPSRVRPSAGRNLALFAEQLSAFPGPVLVVAGEGDAAARPAASRSEASAHERGRRAELAQLASLVTRAGGGARVRIVAQPTPAPATKQRDFYDNGGEPDSAGRAGLTATCADWLVSW
jgi:pimeloyl-ACP methyl ester carboxylesterase